MLFPATFTQPKATHFYRSCRNSPDQKATKTLLVSSVFDADVRGVLQLQDMSSVNPKCNFGLRAVFWTFLKTFILALKTIQPDHP